MTIIRFDLIERQLVSKGVENITHTDHGLKFSCCLGTHKDKKPSAFLVDKDGEQFYKCFSCGTRLSMTVFMLMIGIEDEVIIPVEEIKETLPRLVIRPDDIGKQKVCTESATLKEGLEIFEDSATYLLYPKMIKYLEHRLCKGFKIPSNVKIRYNQERHSIVLKALEDGVTERFSKKSGLRFKNYGKGVIFHHYTEKTDDIILTEGFFDYLTVFNAGFNGVSIMTAHMSSSKFRQLENIVKNKVYLMLDRDKAGTSGTKKITEELIKRAIPYSVIEIPEPYKDPCEMGIELVRETIEKAKNGCLFGSAKRRLSEKFERIPIHKQV